MYPSIIRNKQSPNKAMTIRDGLRLESKKEARLIFIDGHHTSWIRDDQRSYLLNVLLNAR